MAASDWIFRLYRAHSAGQARGTQPPAQTGFQGGREAARDASELAATLSLVFAVFMHNQGICPFGVREPAASPSSEGLPG